MITKMGTNVKIHPTALNYGCNSVGSNSIILENTRLGYPTSKILLEISKMHIDFSHARYKGTDIGRRCIIRSDSVIYCNVKLGHNVRTGHRVLIRENCVIGNHVLVGTNTVIENNCKIGNYVSIQSSVFIPTETVIKDHVFIGPGAILTNDKYPIRKKQKKYIGPIIEQGASLGGGCVVLPEVVVGKGAMVAANAVVTKDVPKWHLAIGSPARHVPLKEKFKKLNKII